MKKILIISLLVMSLFFLSGCDDGEEEMLFIQRMELEFKEFEKSVEEHKKFVEEFEEKEIEKKCELEKERVVFFKITIPDGYHLTMRSSDLFDLDYTKDLNFEILEGKITKDIKVLKIWNISMLAPKNIIRVKKDKEGNQFIENMCTNICNEGYETTENGQWIPIYKEKDSDCKKYSMECKAEEVYLSGYKCKEEK